MKLMAYCNNLAAELTDIARKLDKLSTGEKAKIGNKVNEINMIIEELADRIEQMEMKEKSTTLRLKLEDGPGQYH